MRKIDWAIDFSFIYYLVENLYCEDNGRPSINPVVLIKIVLIQCPFGIRSMRQTIKEFETNWAIAGSSALISANPFPIIPPPARTIVRLFIGPIQMCAVVIRI